MKTNMHFTIEEKIKVLIKNGFQIKEDVYEYSEKEYHNRIIDKEMNVLKVLKGDQDIDPKFRYESFGKYGAVEKCFDNILKEKMYNILMNDNGWKDFEIPLHKDFIDNVCLTYRHDFGLLSDEEKELLRYECNDWITSINKNLK
jgi:hypothetical protein